MRKILSMMMAVVLSVTIANAETTRLYCKVSQGWWKADGAAVALYAWTEGSSSNAAWPGVRMTAVEGEADTWYGDVDPAVYNQLIFVRVNGSGDISDWGAKTANLTFPTDGKNLYTITSESAVWGDPGVAGEWSVKGEQQGGEEQGGEEQGCNWSSLEWLGNGSGIAAYTNAFKVCVPEGVGVVNVQTPGFATAPGIYITLPAVPSACSLAENQYDVQGTGVILHCDAFVQEETQVSFVYSGGECTLTVYRKPSYYVVGDAAALGAWTPANGVKIFGDSVGIHLAAGTYKFKVVNGPSWEGTTSLGYADLKEGQTGLSTDNDGNIVFTLSADADVAVKIENNKVIVVLPAAQGGDEPEPQPTINYYLVGSMQSWSLENAIPLPGDSLVIEDAAAGNYAFKLLPQTTGWDNALTYSNVNAECSSAGITEGQNGNIVVTLAQAGPVKIKVVNGQLCITGNFEVPVTANYYLVGSMQSWSLENAIPMPGDSLVVTWAANVYQFKVLPQKTGWANEMGYSSVNAECSSEGIQDGGGGNIKITLAAETEVKIKVVNGQLCITGNFGGQVEITSYTVVGDPLLIAAGWETTSTATDMTAQQDGSWTYTLSSVDLVTGHNYKYKMVANHSWDVAQYPQSDDYILTVDVNGIYDVVFTLVPGEVGGSAVATLRQATDLMNSVPLPSVMKVIKDGQLYIHVNGQVYTVMGQIVK